MPGRAGRNKHGVLADLTETNLAAHRAQRRPRKQDPERWLAHAALPAVMKKALPKPITLRPQPSRPPPEESWLDWVARFVVEIARGLPGVGVVAETTEAEQKLWKEDEETARDKKSRKKGKKWYR